MKIFDGCGQYFVEAKHNSFRMVYHRLYIFGILKLTRKLVIDHEKNNNSLCFNNIV
mgnify:FL=1